MNPPVQALPAFADVLAAAARIAPHAHATPVLRSRAIDALVGTSVAFKAEHLQRAGAFKFRGACSAVWSRILPATTVRRLHSRQVHAASRATSSCPRAR